MSNRRIPKLPLVLEKIKQGDSVDHPSHYGGDTVYETIKVLEAWLPREQFIGFLRGNIIKYQSRADKKDGIEAYNKATWYSNYLSDFLART